MVRAAAAIIVVPRWQGPDEPQHFLVAASILRDLPSGPETLYALPPAIEQGVRDLEGEIIRSMAREGWWAYYGARTPDEPLPQRFGDGPNLVTDVPGAAGGGRMYFVAASGVIRMLGISDVDREYDVLRGMSLVWGLLTVLVGYAATRVWVGDDYSVAVAAVLGFHPQFVLVATTVSPDAFVNLCGAIAWWQLGRALTHGHIVIALAALWLAALAAAVTRRVGAPLVGMAAIASAVVLCRFRQRARIGLSLVVILAACGATLVGLLTLWPDEFQRLREYFSLREAIMRGRVRPAMASFLWTFWQSTWLAAGWGRFPAPSWWIAAVSAWAAVATGGVAALLLSRGRHFTIVCHALAAVCLQALAIWVAYWGIVGAGAQGRYLFPVIVPFLTLLTLGSATAVQMFWRRSALWVPVVLMITFDLLAWTTVLIPVYMR